MDSVTPPAALPCPPMLDELLAILGRDGAGIQAIHARDCPFWRLGLKHAPCDCGAMERELLARVQFLSLLYRPTGADEAKLRERIAELEKDNARLRDGIGALAFWFEEQDDAAKAGGLLIWRDGDGTLIP